MLDAKLQIYKQGILKEIQSANFIVLGDFNYKGICERFKPPGHKSDVLASRLLTGFRTVLNLNFNSAFFSLTININ